MGFLVLGGALPGRSKSGCRVGVRAYPVARRSQDALATCSGGCWPPQAVCCVAALYAGPFFSLPTLLSALYFFFVATDQYESEARFIVRSAARPEVPGGLSFLVQLGLARSQDDSFIVQEFMTSRDAIEQLRANLPLDAMFHREGADFLASVIRPSSTARTRSGSIAISSAWCRWTTPTRPESPPCGCAAFRPDDARDIAEALLAVGEDLVNRINQRLQTDAIGNSLAELSAAQGRLIDRPDSPDQVSQPGADRRPDA